MSNSNVCLRRQKSISHILTCLSVYALISWSSRDGYKDSSDSLYLVFALILLSFPARPHSQHVSALCVSVLCCRFLDALCWPYASVHPQSEVRWYKEWDSVGMEWWMGQTNTGLLWGTYWSFNMFIHTHQKFQFLME